MIEEEIHYNAVKLKEETNQSLDKCRNAFILYNEDYDEARRVLKTLDLMEIDLFKVMLSKVREYEKIKM